MYIYTLAHQTIYIKKNKFNLHEQYSFVLIFSGNPRKSHTDRGYYKFFYCQKKKLQNQPSKLATAKNFFSIVYVIVTSCINKCSFIPCDNWKPLLFIKLYWYPKVSSTSMFLWSKFHYYLNFIFYLHSNSKKLTPKWKLPKWSSHIS